MLLGRKVQNRPPRDITEQIRRFHVEQQMADTVMRSAARTCVVLYVAANNFKRSLKRLNITGSAAVRHKTPNAMTTRATFPFSAWEPPGRRVGQELDRISENQAFNS